MILRPHPLFYPGTCHALHCLRLWSVRYPAGVAETTLDRDVCLCEPCSELFLRELEQHRIRAAKEYAAELRDAYQEHVSPSYKERLIRDGEKAQARRDSRRQEADSLCAPCVATSRMAEGEAREAA